MVRYSLLWIALFIYGIDWDYYQEVIVYDYSESQEQIKPDENYPLVQIWYSDDESQFLRYNQIVNDFHQGFDLYPSR